MNKFAYILIAFLSTVVTMSAQQAQRLTATKANDYGIIYSLPTTAVDVTIEATITRRQPGEFYKYALKYLNANNPVATPSTSVAVESVTITTHGIANPDQRYLVTLKSNQAPYILISEDNIPLAINTEQVLEVKQAELPKASPASITPLETPAASQVITQEMLQSHSSAKRAELAAEQIYALRQSRTDLITGQAEQMPPDGEAMKLIMDNIDAQEQALMAMFVGTESVETVVRTFTIVPDGDISNQVIARVSAVDGIVDATDLSGFPVYLSIKVLQRGEMPVNEKGETLSFPKNGVAYCIPGSAQIAVTANGQTFAEAEVSLAQLGIVYGMDSKNFTDKKSPIALIFDPATGAAAQILPANQQ